MTGSNQYVQAAHVQQIHQQPTNKTQQTPQQQKRAGNDYRKPGQVMMPSQMSLNNQQDYMQKAQDPSLNFSASNGYLTASQKHSPMNKVQQKPKNTASSKLIRGNSTNASKVSYSKGSINHSNGNLLSAQASQKDLQVAYINQKRQSQGSNVNSEKRSGIDSGVGVISGSGGGGQNSLHPRQNVQRGMQVEMKTAIQSRRKHGSIDTYKQRSDSNGNSSMAVNQIRQGQGEIAPQRVSVNNKNLIYAKNSAVNSGVGQLPKVIRNQANHSSKISNVSGHNNQPSARPQQNQTSSTPSINNSGHKQVASGNQRLSASPSDNEMRYQSSNYTNVINRQSALSRGSIKQSSQHGLSGSNHMNLSLSQNSSRGLIQNKGGHIENSVEQIQERRIAYEASQGKMSNGKSQQQNNSNFRQSQTTAKSSNNEMLLAYSQHHHGPNPPVFSGQDDPSQQVSNIVLHQKQVPQGNANHRHSRIRTKSNHGSLDRGSNPEQQVSQKHITANQAKRGAITVAQNSPRQALTQLKGKQPRIPEPNAEVERYYASRLGSNGSLQERKAAQQDMNKNSYKLAKQMQVQSSSLVPKAPQAQELTGPNYNLSGNQHQQKNFPAPSVGQRSAHQLRVAGSQPQLIEDEQLAFHLHQQQSSSQFNHQVQQNHLNQSRYEQDSATTIEQYSRKLHAPNPILDGGTGSGGAAVSSLQNHTRQLLQDQQVILEKLGYVHHPDGSINEGRAKYESENQPGQAARYQQQVAAKSIPSPIGKHNQISHQTAAIYQPQSLHSHQNSQKNLHNKQPQQKKSTLLQMQQQNQKYNSQADASAAKILNLSHHMVTGSTQHKQVTTKTSAQTANTVGTHKVAHPKFLQYANQSKQSTVNAPQAASNSGKIHMSVKLKKNASQQPTNLIMHQNAGKRSNSQEILAQNSKIQAAAAQPFGGKTPGMDSSVRQGLRPQSKHHYAAPGQVGVGADRRVPSSKGAAVAMKGEKRSSSQPTTILHTNQVDMSQPGAKIYPKHYNEDKKRMYYENRRLSDDPVMSRQNIAGARPSQKSHSQSRTSNEHHSHSQQPHRLHQGHQHRQSNPNPPKSNQQVYLQQHQSDGTRMIDHQSVRVSIDSKQGQKAPSRKHHHGLAPGQDHTSKRLRKQASVPQLHAQVSSGHDRSELSKSTIQSKQSAQMRKSQSNGPGRPQYSVNKPHAVQQPDTLGSDAENRRLITEEDEQEIRAVASDINEQAFYGKIIRTKKAIKVESEFAKLSPRSQEIGSVMQKVEKSFLTTQKPPTTDITFYRIGKMLGRGAFGKVNLAMHKLVRKLVALKALNKADLTDEVQKAKLMKEVNLLLKLRHDHVVKIYETLETQKHIIIVMELCAGGDLLNYVRKRRRLKEPFAQKIFRQIIDGLSYIHSKHVAHRDIKLDNILLDGKGNVKIADFGVSRQIQPDQIMREQCGTPAYIAPEILRNRGYGLNVDLWSAGVVLFAMLYGTVPFKAQTMDELHQLILKGKYLLKEDISAEARDLLRGLLEINPKKRISIRKIYKHPWLRSMDPSVQLFNDEERKMIKKEYTYNDGSRYNRNENEEPVDCFTQHNLESQYSTLKNQESKSIILAPFNSTMSEQSPVREDEVSAKVMELMEVKQQILRFSKKCREIDRQYEFNNNGQLDNGVYHKVVANNSFEQQDKFEETQGIEIEQSLTSLRNQQQRKAGKSASNARNDNQLTASEASSFLTMAEDYNIKNNQPRVLDPQQVQKLVSFGYPEPYIVREMRDMNPNYCTAGYYLLEMDQNYC